MQETRIFLSLRWSISKSDGTLKNITVKDDLIFKHQIGKPHADNDSNRYQERLIDIITEERRLGYSCFIGAQTRNAFEIPWW